MSDYNYGLHPSLLKFAEEESTTDASGSSEHHDRIMWIETQTINGKDFIVVKDTHTNKDYLIVSGSHCITCTQLT